MIFSHRQVRLSGTAAGKRPSCLRSRLAEDDHLKENYNIHSSFSRSSQSLRQAQKVGGVE